MGSAPSCCGLYRTESGARTRTAIERLFHESGNPLTFSIANGLAFGLVSYVIIHLARGRGREIPKAAYPLAILLLIRFVYMGSRL